AASACEVLVDPGHHVGRLGQRVDGGEIRLDRIVAGLFDRRGVHPGAIEPADLLLDRAGLGGAGILRRGFDEAVLGGEAGLVELLEGAPGAAVGWHRVGSEPPGIDETVEVLARRDLAIEILGIEGKAERGTGNRNADGEREWPEGRYVHGEPRGKWTIEDRQAGVNCP